MKRLFVVFVLAAVILGVMLCVAPKQFAAFVLFFPKHSRVFVFCRNAPAESINLGNGYLVECTAESFAQVFSSCGGVDGISVKFCGTMQDVHTFQAMFSVRVVSTLQLDNLCVVCGYSPKICGGLLLDGQAVNIQFAFDGETVTIGCPLIPDSF